MPSFWKHVNQVLREADIIIEAAFENLTVKPNGFDAYENRSFFSKLSVDFDAHAWVSRASDAVEVTSFIMKDVLTIFNTRAVDSADARELIDNAYSYSIMSLEKTGLDLYKNNVDLADAIESGNEILFYKTDGYFLIPETAIFAELAERNSTVIGPHSTRDEIYEFLLNEINQ